MRSTLPGPASVFAFAPQPGDKLRQLAICTGIADPSRFPLNDGRPLFAFAGIWTEFKGDRGVKSKPVPCPHLVYGFLTTQPNSIVEPIQSYAGDPDHRTCGCAPRGMKRRRCNDRCLTPCSELSPAASEKKVPAGFRRRLDSRCHDHGSILHELLSKSSVTGNSGGSHGSNNAVLEMRKTYGPGCHHLRPHRAPMHKL